MTFLTLFSRLGKQPIKYTRQNEVTAVLNRADLMQLLSMAQDEYIIPLELKFRDNGKTILFEKQVSADH